MPNLATFGVIFCGPEMVLCFYDYNLLLRFPGHREQWVYSMQKK